ncbi:type I toxin-antitoxin system Hok family toxin [Klebsiella sp. RHBSTW-00215]|nr:type I toxin-antitoxin system Hok family toxin [Klebsiella sp. RHBSTW-00215]
MKMPRNSLIWCVLIVCITLLAFTWLTRQTLCELRYHTLETEFAATLAYESGK